MSTDVLTEPTPELEVEDFDECDVPSEPETAAAATAARTVAPPDIGSESNLSLYFRDMSGLGVFGPEEEVRIAKQIEEETAALWAQILSYPPMLQHVLTIASGRLTLPTGRVRALQRAAAACRRRNVRGNREKMREKARTAGWDIAAADFDDLALNDVLAELRRVRGGDYSRLPRHTAISARSNAFRAYMEGVEACARRVQRAKHDFVEANLRLVVSIARRFNNGRMPLSDLIQEGNIGLMKAVERFDYRRGFRFSTYASWWIRHAISRALADKGRAVRLPVHMIDTYQRLARTNRELQNQLGRKPTPEELSEHSGIPLSKIRKMNSYLLEQSVSLDRPVNDEDGRRFIDFLVDARTSVNTADSLIRRVEQTEALRVMDELTPIECDILKRRFGLDGQEEATLKEIGEIYNLSRERIRQLQEQALAKVRRALRRKDLM